MADPVSPAAGQEIDKAFWDEQVYQRFVDLESEWTAYAPTWKANDADASIGDGTLFGRYKRIGKTVFWYIRFIWGSTTSSPSGVWYFGLPPGLPAFDQVTGSGRCSSASGYQVPLGVSSSANGVWLTVPGGDAAVQSTVPYTWGPGPNPPSTVGRTITVSGFYETTA